VKRVFHTNHRQLAPLPMAASMARLPHAMRAEALANVLSEELSPLASPAQASSEGARSVTCTLRPASEAELRDSKAPRRRLPIHPSRTMYSSTQAPTLWYARCGMHDDPAALHVTHVSGWGERESLREAPLMSLYCFMGMHRCRG